MKKYTIINSATRTAFISQSYNTEDEAKGRLDALEKKFGDRLCLKTGEKYSLLIVAVDENGEYHELMPKPAPVTAPSKSGPSATK